MDAPSQAVAPDVALSAAERLIAQFRAGDEVDAIARLHRMVLRYSANDETYRHAFVQLKAHVLVTEYAERCDDAGFYHACRSLRALAGSPARIDENAQVSGAVAEALRVTARLVSRMQTCCESLRAQDDAAARGSPTPVVGFVCDLEAATQAVGAIMNLARPPSAEALRMALVRAGAVAALAGLITVCADGLTAACSYPACECSVHQGMRNHSHEDKQFSERVRLCLFSGYCLLAFSRDVRTHFSFAVPGCLSAVTRLARMEDATCRAIGTIINATLAQTFDDPTDAAVVDPEAVGTMLDWLDKLLDPSYTAYVGYKVDELVHALLSMSASDTYKPLLVTAGALPRVARMLCMPDRAEIAPQCAQILHNMCFHADNATQQQAIAALKSDAVLPFIQQAVSMLDDVVNMHITSVLAKVSPAALTLDARRPHRTASTLNPTDDPVRMDAPDSQEDFDVMLSYSWTSQRTVLAIRDQLVTAGFRVWIDVDHMGRDMMDSMASAVERSRVVVLCCCSAYKASPNCRREAEYAVHLLKPVIIANMEHEFVPRGWLGLHVAGKIWCDFRDENADCFGRGISTLLRQLRELRSAPLPVAPPLTVTRRAASEAVTESTAVSSRASDAGSVTASPAASHRSAPAPVVAPAPAPALPPPAIAPRLSATDSMVPLHASSLVMWSTRKPALAATLREFGHGRLATCVDGMSALTLTGLERLLHQDAVGFHRLVVDKYPCSLDDALALAAALQLR